MNYKKPFLKDINKKNLVWTKNHKDWTIN